MYFHALFVPSYPKKSIIELVESLPGDPWFPHVSPGFMVVRLVDISIPYAPWCWNIYQHLPHKSPKCR